MTGSELLAEAKRRYPLGTEYYCATGDGTKGKLITELTLYGDDEVYGKFAQNDCNQYVYRDDNWATIISKPESSRDQLLAKAIRDYPIGTKAKSAYNGKEYTVDKVPTIETNGNISCHFYLYHEGKWAEIVSKAESNPETREDILAYAQKHYPPGTRHGGYRVYIREIKSKNMNFKLVEFYIKDEKREKQVKAWRFRQDQG